MRVSKCLVAVTRSVICSEKRRRYARKKGTAARDNRSYCCRENFAACTDGMTLESFVDCEREDAHRGGGSFQPRDLPCSCLSRQSSEKSSGETAVWETKGRKAGSRGEKKRGKVIGEGEGGGGGEERGGGENEAEENSEKHFRVSGKNSLSRIEEFTRTCART